MQRVLVQIWPSQRVQKSFPHPLLDIYHVWKTTDQQTSFFALPGLVSHRDKSVTVT